MTITAEKARELTKQAVEEYDSTIETAAKSCIADIIEPAIELAAEKRLCYVLLSKEKITKYRAGIVGKVLDILKNNQYSVSTERNKDDILIEW